MGLLSGRGKVANIYARDAVTPVPPPTTVGKLPAGKIIKKKGKAINKKKEEELLPAHLT